MPDNLDSQYQTAPSDHPTSVERPGFVYGDAVAGGIQAHPSQEVPTTAAEPTRPATVLNPSQSFQNQIQAPRVQQSTTMADAVADLRRRQANSYRVR